jgi:hypothetical protein
MVIIGSPTRPLYLQIGISLGSSSRGVFKKLASLIAHFISIKVKAFTLKLAKVEVKT